LSFLLEAADDFAYLTVDFEDAQRLGIIDYPELEEFFLQIIDSLRSTEYVRTLKNPIRKTEFLRAQVIGVLVKAATEAFIQHHDELLAGTFNQPLSEVIPQSDILAKIRRRSIMDVYNCRDVAEVVGAGFELVQGMLDIFVPCVNEMADEAIGAGRASYRSRRITAILPPMTGLIPGGGSPHYQRLLKILDYISGMTDHYAVSLYQKMKGISL
ncbi:MAG: deoxyguanosinetriphosphate triphosphohydrolase, partial [Lentisphaeria bacterium]|nr:deoxyguanosinetriphosphate triphosphohydrolase [Lentisphaeria bacterium]